MLAKVPLHIRWSWPKKEIYDKVYKDDPHGDPETWEGHLHASEGWQLMEHWWSDGNGACDCNRAEIVTGIKDRECGGEIFFHQISVLGEAGGHVSDIFPDGAT